MPTSKELRSIDMNWLDTLIGRNSGLTFWAGKLGLDTKKRGTIATEEDVKKDILLLTEELRVDRMPVTSEVIDSSFGNPLHNCIIRLGGYRYFAELMNLPIKHSETKLGQDYEYVIIDILRGMGHSVIKMTTGHPFDVLVNNAVKIDIKVANHRTDNRGSKIHTFGINKRHGSCDIYITATLTDSGEIDRILVIPSHHLRVVTLCIGENSKYNKYDRRFDYIDKYSRFYKSIG